MMKDVVIAYLKEHDVLFLEKNNGSHLVVEGPDCFIDLWPSSGKWRVRNGGREGFGVRNLIRFINDGI
jgi:hypothetical protein